MRNGSHSSSCSITWQLTTMRRHMIRLRDCAGSRSIASARATACRGFFFFFFFVCGSLAYVALFWCTKIPPTHRIERSVLRRKCGRRVPAPGGGIRPDLLDPGDVLVRGLVRASGVFDVIVGRAAPKIQKQTIKKRNVNLKM
jgi:hypothetical protein